LIDTVYIDNAADAHLLASDRLHSGAPVAGKVYFITQGEPVPLWDLVNRILAAAGLPPVRRSIPPRLAYAIGAVLELAYAICRPDVEPPMTRFLARELSTAHWFNIDAARSDLGYQPAITMDQGLQRLADWLSSEMTVQESAA
jgi:nucleoside-diphosphate-sugar epimerase